MGKLIRLGATALSMIGILVMILCVAFFSVSNPIAFPPGKRYNEKQAKKW